MSQPKLAPFAKAAIAADAISGKILFAKHPFRRLPPASMTKIMTLLLAMEKLQHRKIKWTDRVTASKHASSIKGSRIFLRPGDHIQVRDLLLGIALASGNDAAIALAEHIAGTEAAFVKLMNDKATSLGLRNTHFVNVHGLDHRDHYSCANDMLAISRALLRYQGILKITGLKFATIQKENHYKRLKNTNTLLGNYRGVDGLKTGTTLKAKYCLTATAKKGDTRLIAIVMGEPSAKHRDREVVEILDFSFSKRN